MHPRICLLVPMVVLACIGGEPDARRAGDTASAPPSADPGRGRPEPITSDTTVAGAAAVVRAYYHFIDTGAHARAYALWSDAGSASGQSLEEFREGFAETATVTVDVGAPGRVEPAAGSRYVDVPVRITARTKGGEVQRFEGHYTLRRAVVTGATAEQRLWRIYSAEPAPVPVSEGRD